MGRTNAQVLMKANETSVREITNQDGRMATGPAASAYSMIARITTYGYLTDSQ
jgi:hypothetical protein